MHRGPPHGRHRDVMQARDAGAHEETANKLPTRSHLLLRHNDERDQGREVRAQEPEERGGPVILCWDRQMEGEHAREVHGPDANSCARDASHQPSNPRTPASRADALGEIEPGVRAENGDRNGQSDQTQIVRTDEYHVLGSHRFVPSAPNRRWRCSLTTLTVSIMWATSTSDFTFARPSHQCHEKYSPAGCQNQNPRPSSSDRSRRAPGG